MASVSERMNIAILSVGVGLRIRPFGWGWASDSEYFFPNTNKFGFLWINIQNKMTSMTRRANLAILSVGVRLRIRRKSRKTDDLDRL